MAAAMATSGACAASHAIRLPCAPPVSARAPRHELVRRVCLARCEERRERCSLHTASPPAGFSIKLVCHLAGGRV